MQKFTIWYI